MSRTWLPREVATSPSWVGFWPDSYSKPHVGVRLGPHVPSPSMMHKCSPTHSYSHTHSHTQIKS